MKKTNRNRLKKFTAAAKQVCSVLRDAKSFVKEAVLLLTLLWWMLASFHFVPVLQHEEPAHSINYHLS